MLGKKITIIHHLINILSHILIGLLSLGVCGNLVYFILPNGSMIILLLLSIFAALLIFPIFWTLLIKLLGIINIPISKHTMKRAYDLAQNLDTSNTFSFVSFATNYPDGNDFLGRLFDEWTVGGVLVNHNWSAEHLIKILANKKLNISDFNTRVIIKNSRNTYDFTNLEDIVSGKYEETQNNNTSEIERHKRRYDDILSAIERLNDNEKDISFIKNVVIENARNIFGKNHKKGIKHARITISIPEFLSGWDGEIVGIDLKSHWFPLDKFWGTLPKGAFNARSYFESLYLSEIKGRVMDEELINFLKSNNLNVSMEIEYSLSSIDCGRLVIEYNHYG